MKDKAEIAAITVIVLGIALIAGLVVNENRKGKTEVAGTRFTQTPTPFVTGSDDPFAIPTIPSTIVPSVTPTPTIVPASPTPTATASPRPAATTTATARPAGVASYTISVGCGETTVYSDGTRSVPGSKYYRDKAVKGEEFRYEYNFNRDQGGKTVTSYEKTCSIDTQRVSAGSEPNLRVTLACSGEGTYESAPPSPSTNVMSKTWRLSELLDGFTHTMKNKSGQISERTNCVMRVV